MFDAVSGIPFAVLGPHMGVAVQHPVNRQIAHRMDTDLQAHRVDDPTGFVEMIGVEDRFPVVFRVIWITVNLQTCAALQHAIHEHLDPPGPQFVTAILRMHLFRFAQPVQRIKILQVKRHLHPHTEVPLGFQFAQQLKLVKVAIHVVQCGDPVSRDVIKAFAQKGLISFALSAGRGRIGITPCHIAQHVPSTGSRQRQSRTECTCFQQSAVC